VIADLTEEAYAVDQLVAGLGWDDWRRLTAAPKWTIAHQVGHLAFIFQLAGAAAADPERFAAMTADAAEDFNGAVNNALRQYVGLPPDELLARWRTERDNAIEALAAVPAEQLVPWLVRPLPRGVLACAGLMEAFAHGQDIADALGVRREPTDRLWHLAWFATLVWDFGYHSHGETPPDTQFRYELSAPSGELWEFGPADAEQRIVGPAADFCLLVTRRRQRDDLAVRAVGADADHWLDIAQAYRGPAGPGRQPGQFAD
jgi:uncharacterized protein (TIGR03084 family)